MKKRYYLTFGLLFSIVILAFQNRQYITQYIAEQVIETAYDKVHKDIEYSSIFTFGLKAIDSLYDANVYEYFIFITDKNSTIPTLDSITVAKTLMIYNNKNFTDNEIDKNTLLSYSALFDLLTVNETNIQYHILSVDKNHIHGYQYKVQNIGTDLTLPNSRM